MQIHVVRTNESLWGIAGQYGVTPSSVISINQLPSSDLVPGQSLVIPTRTRAYVVMPGDTLYTIARSYAVSLAGLKAANPQIQGTDMAAGDTLTLPDVSRPTKLALGFLELLQPPIDQRNVYINAPDYTCLSLFGYGMTTSGSLLPAHDEAALKALTQTKATPAATFSNWTAAGFSPDAVHAILSSEALQQQYIAEMMRIVEAKKYRAVVIDFESLYAVDRNPFIQFLAQLRAQLQPLGMPLIVCAMPITGHLYYEGPIIQAYDYTGIARHATFVMIMSYNWSWPGGPPGPVAALPLVEYNIQYALKHMSQQQILLGLVRYGYDWALPYQPGETTGTWEVQDIVEKAMHEQIPVQYDDVSMTPFIQYGDRQGRQHIIWFEDARSLQLKLQLVQKYQLAGIAAWELSERFAQFNPLLADQFTIL